MIFSLKKKKHQVNFFFEGSPLEVVTDYKYLGIVFHNRLTWETCRSKRIQGRWRSLYLLHNRCRKEELWDWKTKKTLFSLLVVLAILYGCKVWGNSMSNHK